MMCIVTDVLHYCSVLISGLRLLRCWRAAGAAVAIARTEATSSVSRVWDFACNDARGIEREETNGTSIS